MVDDGKAVNLSTITREVRLMCSALGDAAINAHRVRFIANEIGSYRPSRLRLAATMRKLRTEHETLPPVETIIAALHAVTDREMTDVARLGAIWRNDQEAEQVTE